MGSDSIHITSRGTRIIRIARRVGSEMYLSRSYYYRCKLKGRPQYFSLGRDYGQAVRLGDQIQAFLFAGGDFTEARQRFTPQKEARVQRRQIASIGDVLDCYEQNYAALDVTHNTARDYGRRLISIVSEVLGERSGQGRAFSKEETRAQPLTVLTRKLVTDLKNMRMRGSFDQMQLLSAKRTLNSRLREAKALFKEAALDVYRDHGLVIPNLSEFLDSPLFARTRVEYQLPKPEMMSRLVNEAQAQLPPSDDNAYLGFVLAFHAGLRASEIAGARWDWLGFSDRPYMRVSMESDLHTKSGRGRTVELEPWVYEYLMSRRKPEAVRMLSGSEKERRRLSIKRLGDWLRSHGMHEIDKPVHELRKWYGSFVAATCGLTEAQRRLGHSSHQVTNDYYSDLEFPPSLTALWRRNTN